MPDARYLVRLDDACPWMNAERWGAVEALLDRYGVSPIVAVVPHCADPELRVAPEDPTFWERARRWQAKGWTIGLHGLDHVFTGKNRGLVPLNDYTEFAGRPEAEQRNKIRLGWEGLRSHGLEPRVWVAPAHTFDRTTLLCLEQETTIRVVSDGLARNAFRRWGFLWIPQQLWRPRRMPAGLWTLCLHPNEITDAELENLSRFLAQHSAQVTVPPDGGVVVRPWVWTDGLFALGFLAARTLISFLRKVS